MSHDITLTGITLISEIALDHICPECLESIKIPKTGAIECTNCYSIFSINDGIARFLPENFNSKVQDAYESGANDATDESVKAGYKFPLQQQLLISAFSKIIGEIGKADKIMDVGCGTGKFSKNLALDNCVVGVDLSFSLLKHAKKAGLTPYQVNALKLPFARNQFDLILSSEVLQLIDDLSAYFCEMRRVMGDDGRLIVSTLNNNSFLRRTFRAIARPGPKASVHAPNKYSNEDVINTARAESLHCSMVSWTHFPFNIVHSTNTMEYAFNVLASNFIITFQKSINYTNQGHSDKII